MQKVLLYDHPEWVTGQQLEEMLKEVSAERKEKALQFRFQRDQVLSVIAYRLLCQGLQEAYSINELPEFDYLENGKPLLRNHPDIHFNMSHCRRGVLCAINETPIGADIEEIGDELDMELCQKCFNDDEIDDIINAPKPLVRFAHWWTKKEAYLKLTGTGLVDNLPALFTPEIVQAVEFAVHESPEKGYVYTTAQYK